MAAGQWGRGAWRALQARRDVTAPERGFTLIEVMITITLLGIVSSAFMGSLAMVENASSLQRAGAAADQELRRYIDFLQGHTYIPCAQPAPAANGGNSDYGDFVPSDPTTFIDQIDWPRSDGGIQFSDQLSYQNVVASADGFDTASSMTFHPRSTSTCASNSDPGAQQLFLKVTYSDPSFTLTRTAVIVKRFEN